MVRIATSEDAVKTKQAEIKKEEKKKESHKVDPLATELNALRRKFARLANEDTADISFTIEELATPEDGSGSSSSSSNEGETFAAYQYEAVNPSGAVEYRYLDGSAPVSYVPQTVTYDGAMTYGAQAYGGQGYGGVRYF